MVWVMIYAPTIGVRCAAAQAVRRAAGGIPVGIVQAATAATAEKSLNGGFYQLLLVEQNCALRLPRMSSRCAGRRRLRVVRLNEARTIGGLSTILSVALNRALAAQHR